MRRSSTNPERMKGQMQARSIFDAVMSVFYILMGVLLLFTNYFGDVFSGTIRIILGILFGLYGFFRVYRAIKILSAKE